MAVALINKDLNLLMVFSMIWEERSLSKAAEKLFVSQSAVSHSLKRLRAEFGDPLFVRDSKGVAPTDFAQTLAPKVRQLLLQVENMYAANKPFDPSESTRKLILSAGDYFSTTMLEGFVSRLTKEAPNVKLILKPVANIFHLDRFEKGEIDLAITAIDVTTKEGFHFKELNQDKISICVRKNHPLVRKSVSAEKYLELKHLNVSNYGSEIGPVDVHLEALGKKREVAMVASSFYDAARLVKTSNLAVSAPDGICQWLAEEYDLVVCPLPFNFRSRSITMVWHERTHQDPFHSWVRGLIQI